MKKNLMGIVLLSSMVLTACSSNPTATTAIQRENNQFEVTGLGKNNIIAKDNAVKAANKTCGRQAPVVIDERTSYNGVLKGVVDDDTSRMVEAAANVLGSVTGRSASLARDDDYQTTLVFQCRTRS